MDSEKSKATKERLLAILAEEDLIPSREIATLLGVSPAAVSNYKKRHESFPESKLELWNLRLYSKTEVLAWAEEYALTRPYGGNRIPKVTVILQLIGRLSEEDKQKVKEAL